MELGWLACFVPFSPGRSPEQSALFLFWAFQGRQEAHHKPPAPAGRVLAPLWPQDGLFLACPRSAWGVGERPTVFCRGRLVRERAA
jgi:hypothetical protein